MLDTARRDGHDEILLVGDEEARDRIRAPVCEEAVDVHSAAGPKNSEQLVVDTACRVCQGQPHMSEARQAGAGWRMGQRAGMCRSQNAWDWWRSTFHILRLVEVQGARGDVLTEALDEEDRLQLRRLQPTETNKPGRA